MRRRSLLLGPAAALGALTARPTTARAATPFTLCTFGDSVLDCARYNERGLDPGQLIVRNDDALFPEFAGRDLRSRGAARLEHRAQDGATVDALERQLRGLDVRAPAAALVSVGGNDLLAGLAGDDGPGIERYAAALERAVRALPVRPVILATVYDPTFGDDRRNFLGVPAAVARRNHARMNAAIRAVAARHGRLADLHAHFLRGSPEWFTRTIEPSLVGASEIRAAFLPGVLRTAGCSDVSKSPARPRYRTPTPS